MERGGRDDFGHDTPAGLLLEMLLRRFGQPPLLLAVVEDRRLVLAGPRIGKRVMPLPENFEEPVVPDPCGIEIDLDRFRMITQRGVARVICRPACIAYARPDDSFKTPEPGVRTPESAQGEGRCFDPRRYVSVDGR